VVRGRVLPDVDLDRLLAAQFFCFALLLIELVLELAVPCLGGTSREAGGDDSEDSER
jgi:hypothetical protein